LEYGYSAETCSGKNTESGTVMVSNPASSAARAIASNSLVMIASRTGS